MTDTDGPYERKIQLTGGTTLTVSLPKAWARAQGLDAGDHVRLHPRGNRLLVTQSDDDETERTVTVSAHRYDPSRLGRIVTAAYVAGARTIRIEGRPNRATRELVRSAVAGLVGVEVASETETAVVVRTMLDVEDLSPAQTLAQMESVTLSAHEAAVEAALAGDGESGHRIANQDDTIDRLFGLVAREFHRSLVDVTGDGAGDGLTTFDGYTVARQLERDRRPTRRRSVGPPIGSTRSRRRRSRAISTNSRSTHGASSGMRSPGRSPAAIPTRSVRCSRTARRSSRPQPGSTVTCTIATSRTDTRSRPSSTVSHGPPSTAGTSRKRASVRRFGGHRPNGSRKRTDDGAPIVITLRRVHYDNDTDGIHRRRIT